MAEENEAARIIYIKRVHGAGCGPSARSKMLYYRNIHPEFTIKITVDHHWFYDGKEHHEEQFYTLSPNPTYDYETPNALDVEMGCNIPGPTLQEFHWDVVAAVKV